MKRLLIVIVILVVRIRLFAIELPINGRNFGPAPFDSYRLRVATAGSQALAVQYLGSWIVGIRIDTRGNLIDPRPLPLFPAASDDVPAIATDGVDWIVVSEGTSLIAHVDANGHVETHPCQHSGEGYSISFSGSGYVMTYVSTTYPYPIRAATLTRDGQVIADRELVPSGSYASLTLVVTESNRALLVMQQNPDVSVVTFDLSAIGGNGAVSAPLHVGTTTQAVNVGWNGRELLLTYKPDDHVHALRLTAGAVPAGPAFVLPANPFQILWTGSAWFIAYCVFSAQHNTFDNTFELRDVDGSLIREMTSPSPMFTEGLAPAGENRLLALTGGNGGQSYVHSFVISDPAERTDDVLLSRALAAQTQLQVARCGDEWRAVWIETSNVDQLLTRRFALSGTPHGDAVTLAVSGIDTGNPASLACTTDSTMVIWKDRALQVHAAALDRDGALRRAFDLGKTSALGLPSVATNGTEYVISFAKEDGSALELQRWSLDGIAIGFPASYTAFDVSDKYSGALLAPVGDDYLGVVMRVYTMTTTIPFAPIAQLRRLDVVRFSQSLVPETTPTPLTVDDGSTVSSVSIRCGYDLCAVTRAQTPDLYGLFGSLLSRLRTTGELIDPPWRAITIAPPNRFFAAPSSDRIGARLFVAADRTVSEVDDAGNLATIATVEADEQILAINHSDQDLVTFIERAADDIFAKPRIFVRVTQARRHGVR